MATGAEGGKSIKTKCEFWRNKVSLTCRRNSNTFGTRSCSDNKYLCQEVTENAQESHSGQLFEYRKQKCGFCY